MAKRSEVFPGAVFGRWTVIDELSDEWHIIEAGVWKGKRVRQREVDCRCQCGRVLACFVTALKRESFGCARCVAARQAEGWSINEAPTDRIAWAAGLFEGEGSIMLRRRGKWWIPRLSLGMTDQDVVSRFSYIVGRGSVSGPKSTTNPTHKPMYVWSVGSWFACEEILTAFLPYFGQRRLERARAVLAWDRSGLGNPGHAGGQAAPPWITERERERERRAEEAGEDVSSRRLSHSVA